MAPWCVLLVLVIISAEPSLCSGNKLDPDGSAAGFCHAEITSLCCVSLLSGSRKCVARHFGYSSVVCECNSTYCDSIGSVPVPPLGQYSIYLSSMKGSRLEASQGQIQVQMNGSGSGEHTRWARRVDSGGVGVSWWVCVRPQVDRRPLPEVPEGQGVRRSHDGCSSHQHPEPVCWSSGAAAEAVLLQWRSGDPLCQRPLPFSSF